MNNIFSKIKNLFGRSTPIAKIPKRESIRPRKEWEMILLVFVMLTLAFTAFAVYFYIQVDNGKFFYKTGSNTLNEVNVNKDLFTKPVDEIKFREDNYVDLNLKETPPDPLL